MDIITENYILIINFYNNYAVNKCNLFLYVMALDT